MTILKNISISGYRSFGEETQYFNQFTKVNLIIGQNNSGKSNFLRLISEVCSSQFRGRKDLSNLDNHLPKSPTPLVGIGENFAPKIEFEENHRIANLIQKNTVNPEAVRNYFARVFAKKREREGTDGVWSYYNLRTGEAQVNSWEAAVEEALERSEAKHCWHMLTSHNGGDYFSSWRPTIVSKCVRDFPGYKAVLIPAVRKMGIQGSVSEGFDGDGLIERLIRLQNPSAENQSDRARFRSIIDFLRTVTGNSDAEIEIPHSRDTIVVHMNGRALPIESLGSGIQEVIILAAAATVLDGYVICIEEPEIHLNPVLQKKLLRYLTLYTKNQYFISTHSAALMDSVGVEIYHVVLKDGVSMVSRVTSDKQRSAVCEDLGYHPSDLLQANCVIWVEGPSDRIYIQHWLNAKDKELIEGIHYVIMFYGGRLASHLSNADTDTLVDRFISLRRLNRRGVIVIDSDKHSGKSELNATKKRLVQEFDGGPGFAWITQGREIENYIPVEDISKAVEKVHPTYTFLSKGRPYENYLVVSNKVRRKVTASKVDVARVVTTECAPNFAVLDLEQRISQLITFIRESNPHSIRPLSC